ncbi:MAG: HlyD family type I secretion periplasmic adaptor subunit [Ewingella sp.]|uniref:HlyD family type I secretion periplasmic adaptor subunit n=1 Tax=Ewingella allii TaxID=3092550 RepID=UPI00264C57C1|nr:HlyD family type I secretion periplasmic adaptor subunit [Ewingella sp.]
MKIGKKIPPLTPQELAFVEDLRAAMLVQSPRSSTLVLAIMLLTLLAGGIWASLCNVEEIVKGEGKIIPASREQVIQSLEGGILEELLVREGDRVEKGQTLLRIDATRAGASWREGQSKGVALEGTVARLRAEAFDQPLIFPASVEAVPSIVRDETNAYQARKKALNEGLAALARSAALAEKEIGMSQPLVNQGLMSEVELLRMKRQANDIRLQINERYNQYRAEANADLVRLESELAQTRETVIARRDLMQRTTLTAPVKGIVKNIRMNTPGGVIPQGADIMEIVPLEDELRVEAKVRPADIAFLTPGQSVMVKLTAYDYAIYGGLEGTLEYISPDSLEDEKNRQPGVDSSFYRIVVRSKNTALKAGNKRWPIIPGMVASVEIKTGEKTIMSYLLKPVMKAREAFRER